MNDERDCQVDAKVHMNRHFFIPNFLLVFPEIFAYHSVWIVIECLDYWKVCAIWVLKILMKEHTDKYFTTTLTFLIWHNAEGDEILIKLLLAMRLWFSMSVCLWNNNHCNKSIPSPQPGRSSNGLFLQAKSGAFVFWGQI